MSAKGLVAITFRVAGHEGVTVEARAFNEAGDPIAWRVRECGEVLTKDGEWLYEPLPSSRDDAFVDRTRWPTARTAAAAFFDYMKVAGDV